MKVYICDNPYAIDASNNLILTLEPSLLLSAQHIENDFSYKGELAFYVNQEYGMLEIYDVHVLRNFDNLSEQEVAKVCRDVARWWEQYLAWEDRQRINDDLSFQPKDFVEGKDVKVIANDDSTKYAVIFAGMVRGFDDWDDVVAFLQDIGLSEDEIACGQINVLKNLDIGLN